MRSIASIRRAKNAEDNFENLTCTDQDRAQEAIKLLIGLGILEAKYVSSAGESNQLFAEPLFTE